MPPARRRKASPARSAPSPAPVPAPAPSPASKQPEFEFGGPVGAVGVMLGLPVVILVLYFGCGAEFCVTGPSTAAELPSRVWHGLTTQRLWSWTAAAVVFGWTFLHFALYLLLPGPTAYGVKLRDGTRLRYFMNGHLAFWLSLAACFGLPVFGADGAVTGVYRLPLSWLCTRPPFELTRSA